MSNIASISQRQELAATIANQADALAMGLGEGPEYARVLLLKSNIETLLAWTPDDRFEARDLGDAIRAFVNNDVKATLRGITR